MGKKGEALEMHAPIRKMRKALFNYYINKGQTKVISVILNYLFSVLCVHEN